MTLRTAIKTTKTGTVMLLGQKSALEQQGKEQFMVSLQRKNAIAKATEQDAIAYQSTKRTISEQDLIKIVEQASTIARATAHVS